MTSSTPPRPPRYKRKPFDATQYSRYTSLSFQLIASVCVGFGVGYFLDWIFGFQSPVFKTVFSFTGVVLGLYIVIKEVMRKE